MNHLKPTYRFIITFSLILSISTDGPAQNNTLYFMHGIPQAIHTNPALYYKCKTYIELPVLSSVQFSFATTGIGYHDAIHYGSGSRADSLVIDVDNVAKKTEKQELFQG